MDLKLHEVVSFLFQRVDATQTFWNFYIVVATAILGFVGAAKKEWLSGRVCIVLTIAFGVFAVGNYGALENVRDQRVALINVARKLDEKKALDAVLETTQPPPFAWQVGFHGALDLMVLGVIWVSYWRQKRVEPEATL